MSKLSLRMCSTISNWGGGADNEKPIENMMKPGKHTSAQHRQNRFRLINLSLKWHHQRTLFCVFESMRYEQ